MRIRRSHLLMILMALAPGIAAAEYTIQQPVARLSYDATGNYLYITGAAKWGAPSCSNATYVWILPTLPNHDKMMSIILAAQMAGKSVFFSGSCHTDPDYFTANYIWVE
jgi:hypothetical protein